jgi:hypothetical protein
MAFGNNSSVNIGNSGDVALNNPTDGQALVYDGTAKKWKNGTVSGGSGASLSSATPQPLAATGSAGTSMLASRADHVHPTTGLALMSGGQRIFVQSADPGSAASDGDIWIQA